VKSESIFKSFGSQSPQLKGIVAYYYLHYNLEGGDEEFVYYPHYRNAITVYLRSDVKLTANTSTVIPNDKAGLTLLYTRNYNQRIRVRLTGPFTKLGIAFEPLGLQRFIMKSYKDVAHDLVVPFEEFGSEFEALCTEILKNPADDPSKTFDAYLLSKMCNPLDPQMEIAVQKILQNDEGLQLENLAGDLGLSMRTLQRRFKDHLACTPREYQQLVRFRKAINTYQSASKPTTFTQLALETNYYDQPAFVNHFKRITGRSPREFFNNLQKRGSEDTYWAYR
jgi:AraC-like DNA-binding protein